MKPLSPSSAAVLEKCAFDPKLWEDHHSSQVQQIEKRYKESGAPGEFICDFHKGLRKENSRLLPTIKALLEIIDERGEALHIMKQVAPKYHCDECEAVVRDMDSNIFCNCGARTAHSAISNTDKRLKELCD